MNPVRRGDQMAEMRRRDGGAETQGHAALCSLTIFMFSLLYQHPFIRVHAQEISAVSELCLLPKKPQIRRLCSQGCYAPGKGISAGR